MEKKIREILIGCGITDSQGLDYTVKELKEIISQTESTPLTFGELKDGDMFITFPTDGDDSGHGGFRGASYVFFKELRQEGTNACRMEDNVWSCMSASMKVCKIIS